MRFSRKKKQNYNCRLSRASPNDANATNTTAGFSSHPNMPLVYRYRYFQHHGQFTSYTNLEYGWKGPIDRWFPWAQRLASELFIVGDPCDGVTIGTTCGRKGPKPMRILDGKVMIWWDLMGCSGGSTLFWDNSETYAIAHLPVFTCGWIESTTNGDSDTNNSILCWLYS